MKHPISTDHRYTITREHCGYAKPRHVLYWCNYYVANFPTYAAAVACAMEHKAQRDAALASVNR